MSSLTKMFYVERERRGVSPKGGKKTPMMLHYPIPVEFEEACITLLSGDFHFVAIKENRPTRTGFFELDLDAEDTYHAKLVDYLFTQGQLRSWGGISTIGVPPQDMAEAVASYFESYGLNNQHGFVGLIGFASLVIADLLKLPVEVEDLSAIDDATLVSWMDEHLHVGKLADGTPVYYNPEMTNHIVFTAKAKDVGIMTRAGEFVSVVVHNAERGVVILQVSLTDELSKHDIKDDAEEPTGPPEGA